MQLYKYAWGSRGITVQSSGLSYLISVGGGRPIGESTIINTNGRIEVDNITARGEYSPGVVMIGKDAVVTVLETCPLLRAKAEAREFDGTPWGDVDAAVEDHQRQCEHRTAMMEQQDPDNWVFPPLRRQTCDAGSGMRLETMAMT